MRAIITFKDGSKITEENLTEIHYNYPHSSEPSIAFESDIRQSGRTSEINNIKEIVILPV